MEAIEFKTHLNSHLNGEFGTDLTKATNFEIWQAMGRTVVELISKNWQETLAKTSEHKQAHYFSAEFLAGRSLYNNLLNLGLIDVAQTVLSEAHHDLAAIINEEPEPGLGNGGLGRLAACFIDSAATLDYPVTGYGILYRYGLFKQSIENGFQVEKPSAWIEDPYPFTVCREADKVLVHYNDFDVYAVPYDMPVLGFGSKTVNTIRLWKPLPPVDFDYKLFNSQHFDEAVLQRNRVQDIWRVLYPNDESYNGKVLRVRQQYFFVSASLQVILQNYVKKFGTDFTHFADENVFQLNDTHPVLAIAELIRLLTDSYALDFSEAFALARQTFAFTNHTVLAEAHEKWDVSIFQKLFPEILAIISRINEQFVAEMRAKGFDNAEITKYMPLQNGQVYMSYLASYVPFSVNGVAKIHTEIIKNTIFPLQYKATPEKFNNKTNGVTQRRWLYNCNRELSDLLTRRLGSKNWVKNMQEFSKLHDLTPDHELLSSLQEIKHHNKMRLQSYLQNNFNFDVPCDFIYDVQVKRLHEYKRQLLNILEVYNRYLRIKKGELHPARGVAYIFGAKAAPGYFNAKAIIKLIHAIGDIVNRDPASKDYLRVIFIPEYNVSKAELIFPAADISEQISTVGMEASGTGNMKFMFNGALTLGTYDGANIEIIEKAGEENAFMFGPKLNDFPATKAYYDSKWQYRHIEGLKETVDVLQNGVISDDGSNMFKALFESLLGNNGMKGDPYYVLGDFAAYRDTRDRAYAAYENTSDWQLMCWNNIINSYYFSSDRTIEQYAKDIWHLEKIC